MLRFKVLFTSFLPLGLLSSQLSQVQAHDLSVSAGGDFFNTPASSFRLFKRRRGGGDGDSDGSSGGGSSGEDEDDDDDEGCTGPRETCTYSRNGYGKWYEEGDGKWNSTTGGFTPDGSGEEPRWLMRDGHWQYEWGSVFEDESLGGQGWYLGGAFVPFPSGDTSPNGLKPIELDLNNPGQHTPNVSSLTNATVSAEDWYGSLDSDDPCDFEPLLWAYKYPATTNLTYRVSRSRGEPTSELVNVYCVCEREGLCGCDDPEPSNNFTGILMVKLYDEFTLTNSRDNKLLNLTTVCDVHLNGEHAFLVQGTLDLGSTKRDPDMERTNETAASSYEAPCPGSCPSRAPGLTGLVPSGWTVVLIVGLMIVWDCGF